MMAMTILKMTRQYHLIYKHSALLLLLVLSVAPTLVAAEENISQSRHGGTLGTTKGKQSTKSQLFRSTAESHEQQLPHLGNFNRKQHRRGKPEAVGDVDASIMNSASTSSSTPTEDAAMGKNDYSGFHMSMHLAGVNKMQGMSNHDIDIHEITPISRSTGTMTRQQDSRRVKRLGSQYVQENYALMESMIEATNDHKETDSNSNSNNNSGTVSNLGDDSASTNDVETNAIDGGEDETNESSSTTDDVGNTHEDDDPPRETDGDTSERSSDNNVDTNEEEKKAETINNFDSSATNDNTVADNYDNKDDWGQNEDESKEEDSFVNDQIVGGTNAGKNQFPFFVHWSHYCGASLIWEDIILTAAHCNSNRDNTVRIGARNWNSCNDINGNSHHCTTRSVTTRVMHHDFDFDTFNNDFMVMKLNQSVDASIYPPIAINRNSTLPLDDSNVRIVGFGSTMARIAFDHLPIESFSNMLIAF